MGRLTMPITVRRGVDSIELVVQAAGPRAWRDVEPAVLRAAGLAAGTPLHWGAGRVEPGWVLGSPPLLAGCVLHTQRRDDLVDEPLVQLVVVAGPDAGRAVPVGRIPITVGRDPSADLTLSDPQVSFRHALLRPTPTGLAVTDLGSTNGVFVDGVAAQQAADAETGALIRIGGTLLQVQLSVRPAGAFAPDGAGHLVRASPPPPRVDQLAAPPPDPGPPPERRRRPLPLVSAVLGGLVGASLAIVLKSPIYLAFAALGPVTMLGTALSDRWGGRRSHRKELASYREALAAHREGTAAAVRADRRAAWRTWPDPATLLRWARSGDARLWSRTPEGPDYLRLAVGSGSRPLRGAVQGDPPAGDGASHPDPGLVADVPITIDAHGVLGLVGPGGRRLARWLLLQLVCHHSPTHLALTLVGARADLLSCRTLPHVPGAGASTGRPAVIGAPAAAGGRHLVAVLDGRAAIRSPAGRALLAAARPRPAPAVTGSRSSPDRPPRCAGTSVLCLVERAEDLPAGCTTVRSDPGSGVPGSRVDVTGIDADLLAHAVRALTPLRDPAPPGAAPPRQAPPLSDLLGPIDPAALRARWTRPAPRATIGAGPAGPVTVDLDQNGPHLLIAGTTGSGKSELLRSLIAGLAVTSSPQHLTFLLVDYKGGTGLRTIAALPHVVGVLTDLDPAHSARALASLRAELRRREHLESSGGPALARLVLVVDEFATLAVELPDFMAGILDIAQRGRSLGLHLVLATQRPAGVVSPAMRANISARICLRVTDPADSIDVIGVPDAVHIDADTPGRAVLSTGRGRVPFQTAPVSAPLPPPLVVHRMDDPGEAEPDADSAEPPTVEQAIVRAGRQAADGDPPPARPWLPPLPGSVDPGPDRPETVALADLPDEQRREEIQLPDTSILVTGPAASGRSWALRRLALAATRQASELLVVDATGSLADLGSWPQVSSYLTLDEPRLVQRLLTLLVDHGRRRPGSGWSCLVVDGYDLVTATLDRLDYTVGAGLLTDLPARTAGTVRVFASGATALMHSRAATGFREQIALHHDPGVQPPGRGRWAGRLVQIARAAPGETPPRHAAGRPGAADPVVVRPLPHSVALARLPDPAPAAVPWGLGGDAAGPVAVDLATGGGAIVVTGARGTGVSTALDTLASGAARCAIPVLRIVHQQIAAPAGTRATPDGERGARTGISTVDVRDGTEPLRSLLSEHRGPLLLVVDQCGDGDEHPAAEILERFCRVSGPGQTLLIGERPDLLARAHRGHLRSALAFRRGLLLAPDAADGALLDVLVPRRTDSVPPGRGVWVCSGEAVPIQIAAE